MNRKSSQILWVFLLLGMLYNFSSCGSSKKAAKKKKAKSESGSVVKADSVVVVEPNVPNVPVNTALADKYSPIWKREIDFKTFSGKAKCHFEGKGQNHDFTAHVRIRKNEAAWVMITALGGIVNVARIYVTPDSFRMINYIETSYLAVPSSEANKVLPFPVDFTMLQNLLIGNALRTDGDLKNVAESNDAAMLMVEKDNFNQDISIAKATNLINALKLYLDNDNAVANVSYSDYQNQAGRNFPKDRTINVVNNGEQYLLEMNFNEANFDGNVEMPFSVPKSFNK